jgi:4-alpha-glucanotransferase
MQDVLGLGGKSRMNIPGIQEGNWEWRMKSGDLKKSTKKKLLNMTVISGRG